MTDAEASNATIPCRTNKILFWSGPGDIAENVQLTGVLIAGYRTVTRLNELHRHLLTNWTAVTGKQNLIGRIVKFNRERMRAGSNCFVHGNGRCPC